ncbi:uncharacterized protein LOC135821106 [Sycon ciliatum]|uniref:uncharacterized protein LOC135821106 n=1 Tax=Sycon ciliatum TaxID=27933 RepID=UPI0031F60937
MAEAMATSNAGFEEEILIESTDHRKIANDPPVDSPHHAPYHATFNIRCGCAKCAKMSKPNLGHGTAFLLYDLNRLSGEYYYLATAAHNLYCYNCGDYRWVQIIEKWQETSEGPSPVFLSKRITKKNADGWLKVPEWYEKNAKQSAKADRFPHDYGIVAASRETTMSAPFTTLSKVLKAAPNATEKKKNSFLLGFPGRIYANGAWVRAKKCKYWVEAPGSVEGFNDALVKHYIDSSAGQSGCVLYTLDEAGKKASALGIHVGGNDAEKYNVAVKLCSGSSAMAELKGWASNPPHGDEEEFDLDDDGVEYIEMEAEESPDFLQDPVREERGPPSTEPPPDEGESSYGDPFEHSTFIQEISPWLRKLPATTFRNKAQDAGFFTDLQQIRALTRTERQHGTPSHNEELIEIVSSEEQAGFIKLVKVIKHWGKYPDKVDKMNQLLPRRARV